MKECETNWRELVSKLNAIREEKGLTHQNIADATGLHQSNIARFFAARYCPKMELFDKIANALDHQLDIKSLQIVCKSDSHS